MEIQGKYRGGYHFPEDDKATALTTTTSVDKILQAIALLTSIRTDEVRREDGIDEFLSFTIEGLTKIAENESVAGMLPQEDNTARQQGTMHLMSAVPGLYKRSGRVGG